MGSIRKQLISDLELCRLYAEGFSRTELGWRSRLHDAEVRAILERNGVPLRTSADSQALARARRLRLKAQLAATKV